MLYIYEGLFTSFLLIYIAFLDDHDFIKFSRLWNHEFFYFFFLYGYTPPFYINIIPWYHCIYNYIVILFFVFCSRIVNIIADIFVLHRVFVYISWTFYKIQNIQNTKFFADSELQNTKFIFYVDKIFFLEHLKSA